MKASSESNFEVVATLILALIASFTALPMILLIIGFFLLLGKIKTSKLLILGVSSIFLILYCWIFPQAFGEFMTTIFARTNSLISDFTVWNVFKFILIDSFIYGVGSYIFMILLSIIIAIVIYEIYAYRKRLINADVTTFTRNVDSVAEEKVTKSATNKPKDYSNITVIGTDSNKNEVYTNDDSKHIFICGTTGSGKTVLLSNYILSAVTKGYPALIVDGKGDIGEGSILEVTRKFCTEHNKKLYVINMTDINSSDKYNPFKDSTATVSKDMLINMTVWSEEHYKLNTERFLQRLFILMEMSDIPLTFKNILQNLNIEAFELLSTKLTKEKKITKGEHLHNIGIAVASGKIAETASARFASIAESQLGTLFDDNGVDIYTALKENAIILFVLNPLEYPEVSPMFGKLVLIDATKAVSKLFTNNDKRIFFILDEINSYASNTLVNLINKSRSAKVTVIPATQSLADLEAVAGEAFREQIVENCNNYVVLRQNGSKGAETWAKILGTVQGMEITHQLGNNDSDDTVSTGKGSAKIVREFIYHPDEIKSQKVGKAIYLSRDEDKHARINVKKPF